MLIKKEIFPDMPSNLPEEIPRSTGKPLLQQLHREANAVDNFYSGGFLYMPSLR